MRSLVLLSLVACGSDPKPNGTTPKPDVHGIDASANLEVASEDVTFTAAGRTIQGTLTHPVIAVSGTWTGVLILAGSGPTDRDWNSALLATKNGSGKLLATELAKHGAFVLRFDKAGSGTNPGPPIADWSIDTYRDEAAAALALLRTKPVGKVFVAGHSEGGLHATRLASIAQPPLAGVVYLASASRTMAETVTAQLEAQLKNPMAMLSERAVENELASIRQAFADFIAGKTVDPTTASRIPQVQQFIAGLVNPAAAKLTRALISFDNAAEAPKLAGPFYVTAGGKDVQIDPERDGKRLEKALRAAGKDVTFHLSPDCDHVLKHQPLTMEQIRGDLQAAQDAYNAEGRTLDPDFTTSLVAWLAAH